MRLQNNLADSLVRLNTSIFSRFFTAKIASTCDFACTPVPKTAPTFASFLARIPVARPETAPVRMAVTDYPSKVATMFPLEASKT